MAGSLSPGKTCPRNATDGDPTSTFLQNCASDSSKFFLLTSSSQIVTTFQAIGTNLTQLRIAH